MQIKMKYILFSLLWLLPAQPALADSAVSFNANAQETKQIPVLRHQVRMGETITADDITYDMQPMKRIRSNIITDASALIGKTPKHDIAQGRPIRQDEVAHPAILMKGARVTMLYRSNNLEIRTLGEALDNGAKGDVIRIRNLASKAIIDAVVVSSDLVRVSSPESSSAEAM